MRRQAGFTLVEIALVLVVIGVLISGAVAGIGPVLESSHTATTNSRMDRIELALLAYVMQNGCLPCPANGSLATTDTNAGWSHSNADYYGPNAPTVGGNRPCTGSTGTSCNSNGGGGNAIGIVPWNTLGLREADIVDGWNSRISYAVTSSLTLTAGTSMTRTLPASYPAGTLSVSNNASTSQTAAAAYVLISHGRDRTFAFAASSGKTVSNAQGFAASDPEGVNSPTLGTGTSFRQDTVNLKQGSTSTYFDDIVRYRNAPTIIRDCGANACGNPAS